MIVTSCIKYFSLSIFNLIPVKKRYVKQKV